jgi:hypothetical protein
MREELRKKAKKRVEARMGFYITGIVFFFVTIVLLLLSTYLPGYSFLAVVTDTDFRDGTGYPVPDQLSASLDRGSFSEDWQEVEIEKEMTKLHQQKAKPSVPPEEELPTRENLELKELEHLKDKRDWGEDLV